MGAAFATVCALAAPTAGLAADLQWPADFAQQTAARMTATTPSGNSASAGADGTFESVCRVDGYSGGGNFSTMPCALTIVFK